jgi:hypothetical protein
MPVSIPLCKPTLGRHSKPAARRFTHLPGLPQRLVQAHAMFTNENIAADLPRNFASAVVGRTPA